MNLDQSFTNVANAVAPGGYARRLYRLLPNHLGLGDQWTSLWFFRYLAADHQYRHDHHHIPHGLPDSEHPKPGRRDASRQA